MPPLSGHLWLNHHVLLVINPAGAAARISARWRISLPGADSGSPVRAELLGFATPVEAGRAVPGTSAEFACNFVVPEVVPSDDESFLPFLRTALSWGLPAAETHLLAERLHLIREATRLHHPAPLFAGRPLLCVDVVARSGEFSVYLKGWWRNCHGRPVSLTAISPEGERHDLLGTLCHFPRNDIEPAYAGDLYTGFTAFFRLDQPSLLRTGWLLEIETADGFIAETPTPSVLEEPEPVLAAVLPDMQIDRSPLSPQAVEQVHGIISQLQARRLGNFFPEQELQFGAPPPNPVLSVIIPLYGRVDLIEHQLAQFALDPAWAGCDLIYLLDSPELWQRVAWRAEWLARLYRLSLRIVRCNQSGGYAAVNNVGARLARASLLLFLNSDVLPVAPGWIERMMASYRRRPGIGALGPKLLFEDNSIQHAGVGYVATNDGFGWDTLPFFKGLHRNFPEAAQPRRVPAVTGACLMVDQGLFQSVNGFDQGYIQGDFEDMDLCLRLLRAGCQNWYDPEIELYHLEGVSYPLAQRMRHATYNRWLHSHKWSAVIEKLVNQSDASVATAARIIA